MKRLVITLGIVLGFAFAPLAVATPVGASVWKPCNGNSEAAVCADKTNNGEKMIKSVVDLLFYVIGVIAVVVIIIGGIKFVTADGDSSKIKSARETILYAVVGLVVALMAYAIVEFTVNNI